MLDQNRPRDLHLFWLDHDLAHHIADLDRPSNIQAGREVAEDSILMIEEVRILETDVELRPS